MNIFTSSKAFTMLPIEIGLGDAHLQSRGSGISVELKSSAQFASSAEDDIDQLRQRLTSALLTDREDGKPWIRRGDSFKLVLSLHLQDVLDTAGRDEVVHILTGNVQSAEIWTQLHLTPLSICSSLDAGNAACTITAHLDYDDSPLAAKRQLHKLGADVPFYDARPPEGVDEVVCEAVHVSFALSHRQQRKRKRHEDIDALNEYRNAIDSDHTRLLNESGDDEVLVWPFEEICSDEHEHSHPSEFESCDVECDPELETDEPAMLDDSKSCEDVDRAMSETVAGSWKGSSCATPAQYSSSFAASRDCVQAIENAVQLAICGPSSRAKRKFRFGKRVTIWPLTHAMPSIWCPDYLPNVASRVIFIPTIAHALGSVLDRAGDHSKTESSPAGISASPRLNSASHTGKLSALPAVSVQLWRKLQVGLHTKHAARQLNLLFDSASEFRDHADIIEDLLECDHPRHGQLIRLEPDEYCEFEEDEWDSMIEWHTAPPLFGEEILADCEIPEDVDHLEEDPFAVDLDFNHKHGLNRSASDYCTPFPVNGLDDAGSVSLSIWHGGESSMQMLAPSHATIMPSQSLLRPRDPSPRKTKQPAFSIRARDSWCLPEGEGQRGSIEDTSAFEDRDGDEMLPTEADSQSLPSDDIGLICI